MNPATPPLPTLLSALVASRDPVDVAYGHNYRFEERVSAARQKSYEEALGLARAVLPEWQGRHKSYLFRSVYVNPGEVPGTFSPLNIDALQPAPAPSQWMVRIENFGEVLHDRGPLFTMAKVQEQLEIWRRNDDQAAAAKARQFLEGLCETWNTEVRKDYRPMFASFFDEVEEEVTADDWPHRLRDRLGLSHYDVPPSGSPIAVALMRYRVAEVLAGMGGDEQERAFAVPTVLDGELNVHFFPSPREVVYGRTLDLRPDEDCERLVAELLHRRIEYTPDHLYRVGWMTSPIPPYDNGAAFARLRNGHLFCLRYESGREDFGADIPGGDDG
jgi:hypothetical protein